MMPLGSSRITPLILGSAIALARFFAAPELPKEPCALLKPAEIQSALAPDATIGNGKPSTDMLPIGVSCTYTWGPTSSKWGRTELTVTVIDGTQEFHGLGIEDIQQGFAAMVQAHPANSSVIQGVGDAGAFTYEAGSFNATAQAYYKSKSDHLVVRYHEGDALQAKEKLISLLKTAGKRL